MAKDECAVCVPEIFVRRAMREEDQMEPTIPKRLRTWPVPFQATWDGRKPYEVRHNDREFAVGDTLFLDEWHPEPAGAYSGRCIVALVTYMTAGGEWDLPEHVCVLGVRIIRRVEMAAVIRGIGFACESCGSMVGSTLDDGFHRCNKCGYPSK